MSLLWRKQLRIGLCADRLVLRNGKSGANDLALDAARNDLEWRAAVDALPGVLSEHRNHDVRLVLANQFVRYTLLPWNAALRTEEQWLALARHRLGAVHGAAVADWDVKLAETAPSGPRLACAVDRALIEALAAAVTAANARLVSVQPFLVAAFNRIRSSIGHGSCWLVIEEPGRLTLSVIQRGTWTAIRSRRTDGGWRERLPEIIERESVLLALSEHCTRVIIFAQGAFDPSPYTAWHAKAVSYSEVALAGSEA